MTFLHRPADDLPAVSVLEIGVGVLDEHAAANALVVTRLRVRAAALGVEQDPRSLLLPQRLERGVVVPGREQHLDELLCQLGAEELFDLAVEDDHAAVGRHGIAGERLVVRLFNVRTDGDAARVCVLDDHAGGLRELADERAPSVEVAEVVERQRLPVQLLHP